MKQQTGFWELKQNDIIMQLSYCFWGRDIELLGNFLTCLLQQSQNSLRQLSRPSFFLVSKVANGSLKGSLSKGIFERHTSTGSEYKWGLFVYIMTGRYQICIVKCLYSYRNNLAENLG